MLRERTICVCIEKCHSFDWDFIAIVVLKHENEEDWLRKNVAFSTIPPPSQPSRNQLHLFFSRLKWWMINQWSGCTRERIQTHTEKLLKCFSKVSIGKKLLERDRLLMALRNCHWLTHFSTRPMIFFPTKIYFSRKQQR